MRNAGVHYKTTVYGNLAQSCPAAVCSSTDVIEAAGGQGHGVARYSNGSVTQWPASSQTVNQSNVPVLGGRKAVQIAVYGNYSIALLDNGLIVPWGHDWPSQDGLSVTQNVSTVAAGANHVVVALANGSLAGFGSNMWGQLNIPHVLREVGAKVVQVAAGISNGPGRVAQT
jgi:hypothetical protein